MGARRSAPPVVGGRVDHGPLTPRRAIVLVPDDPKPNEAAKLTRGSQEAGHRRSYPTHENPHARGHPARHTHTASEGQHGDHQSLLSDRDVSELLHTAPSSMQRSAAGVIGSNEHRKLLRREGIAYTLRFGPALVFLTPNLADTKQPLLLVAQGADFYFGEYTTDLTHT